MLIFSYSRSGRGSRAHVPEGDFKVADIPLELLRTSTACLPEASELDTVRHYTRLSQQNFAIDTHFYPLGSCTMKYNPRAANTLAGLQGFLRRHPLEPDSTGQGVLSCLYELQEMLCAIAGMKQVSLAPMAGAQGEFTGVAMIRAYHEMRGDSSRTEIIVPDAAHGTNPATAAMCGYRVREIPTGVSGDVDFAALSAAIGPATAGIMLTNPSTLGVFERQITDISRVVHQQGALLYYDGANMNAILGKVRPGDMGFDVMHFNLHKTFSTPHGGGGPGAGAVAVGDRLLPFLPLPLVVKDSADKFRMLKEKDCPQSIGRLSTFNGNIGVLLRAYVYMRMLGHSGMERVGEYATLNAAYLARKLAEAGFDLAYPERRASHEFIISLKRVARETGVRAVDFAKRLLDYGFHAPTTYFPLLVPECLLIEPTETESKETLDSFVDAMASILHEARTEPEKLLQAPLTMRVGRLDEVLAAREPNLIWKSGGERA